MENSRRTQADRTAATRAALIAAGRKLFAEHGFAGVGTEAVVREARVSRGALYHQFGDKTELFAAVLSEVEGEVTRNLAAAVLDGEQQEFGAVMTAALAFWLDVCETPQVQRIVLVDGPSVLGWRRWRDICQQHMLGLVEQVVGRAIADGEVPSLPARPLAHLLLAMADEAALYVGTSQRPELARAEMEGILAPLLQGLTGR